MGVGQRIGVQACRHQARDVGDVGHQKRPHLVGDGAEVLKIEEAAVGGSSGDDQLGSVLVGEVVQGLVVQAFAVAVDRVADHPVVHAREVHRRAVGEVPTVRQIHPQHGVAGLEQGVIDGQVGRRAGVRLYVGPTGAEQRLEPLDGQPLDRVDDLAAAVVALARVPLGVLVC